MEAITFGCSSTNKTTSGNYDYYLMSRIDNYALILREKTDSTEWLFRIILETEDITTVFAAATTQTYVRPDKLSTSEKTFIVNKMSGFLKASGKNAVNSWS